MNINNSDRFRCIAAIEQGGFTFEAGKVYFLKTRSDTAVSIYRGVGGVGNFTNAECERHFVQVVKVKCIEDVVEQEEMLHKSGDVFHVADSGSDEYELYSGSNTEPATIAKALFPTHFKEVA